MKNKDGNIDIVWAGRFIPLKHPEYMIRLAGRLKGERVHIHMAGGGEMEEQLKEEAMRQGLGESITFYGFRTPEEVRRIMEKCHIHIFTSNHLEGWGAVVNEAMNSGCAVVANVQAGAVPYLIQHKRNGMVYPGGSYEKMEEAVRFLLSHPAEMEKMGQEAYRTVTENWNARHGVEELLRMAEGMKEGRIEPPKEGPLSPAPVIAPGKMYQYMMENQAVAGS